ncbi:hypothetical protein K438DRAFT_1984071 [Mycena galopus ATCC 62051]|nr:hypothetical protein K438DRAFT_1984071 [Mycena galopus ATCC 62051]
MAYPALGNPTPVSIPVVVIKNCDKTVHYPLVEGFMQDPTMAPTIYDSLVTVKQRLSSGGVVSSRFRCYFKRHMGLPLNLNVGSGVRGDLVIMRGSSEDFFDVVDLQPSDRAIADIVSTLAAAFLEDCQSAGTPLPVLTIMMVKPKMDS